MINTDKIKSYLILKNQRHQRSICRKIGISLMLLLIVAGVNAGFKNKIDSLKQVIATTKEDTTRINALNALGWELRHQNPDTSILLGKQALAICEQLSSALNPKSLPAGRHGLILNHKSSTLSNLGVYYRFKGDYTLSISHHFKALAIRKELQNLQGIAVSLGNIGIVYYDQGEYPNALKHYAEALEIAKELGDKRTMANNLANIGIVYRNQGEYHNALKHYAEALEIDKELGDKRGMAADLGNIGIVYYEHGEYPNALKHYAEALEIAKELGDKRGMAAHLGNIGIVYYEQANTHPDSSASLRASALKHYTEALKIAKELGDKRTMANNLGNIGSLFTKTGRFKNAEVFLDSALKICENIGYLSSTMDFENSISQLYDTTGRWQLAYEHYKKYSAAKDSLFNEEKSKEIGRLEQKHEFEMAEIDRKKVESEKLKAESERIKRRDLLQYSAILIGIILFFGLILLMGKFNVPVWVVEASVFMLFLLIFEFTLVLLDPTIDAWTGGAPAYKLLLNAALAGLIFPVHGLCERLLKKKIMERR